MELLKNTPYSNPRGQEFFGHIKKEWQIKIMTVFFFTAHKKGLKFHVQPQTGAYSCFILSLLYLLIYNYIEQKIIECREKAKFPLPLSSKPKYIYIMGDALEIVALNPEVGFSRVFFGSQFSSVLLYISLRSMRLYYLSHNSNSHYYHGYRSFN